MPPTTERIYLLLKIYVEYIYCCQTTIHPHQEGHTFWKDRILSSCYQQDEEVDDGSASADLRKFQVISP